MRREFVDLKVINSEREREREREREGERERERKRERDNCIKLTFIICTLLVVLTR